LEKDDLSLEVTKKGNMSELSQRTVIFLKPEAMRFLGDIRSRIKKIGKVTSSRSVTLNEEVLRIIYPDLNGKLWDATRDHLCGQQVAVFIVEGEDVIRKMLVCVGQQSFPSNCLHDSLRYVLWKMNSIRFSQQKDDRHWIAPNMYYSRNFIHRAKSVEQAEREIAALMSNSLVWTPI